MIRSLCLGLAALALACGGSGEQASQGGESGTTAQQAGAAGSQPASGGAAAGAAAAGAAGTSSTAGSPAVGGAAAGQPGGSGTAGVGGGSSGATTGGSGGSLSDGGKAGAQQGGAGGSGGKATDPLEPKPAVGCVGYVDIYVPEQTCIWIHGAKFTTQDPTCMVQNPSEQTCATVSALPKDSQGNYGPRTVRVTSSATFERLDIPEGSAVCPKACN